MMRLKNGKNFVRMNSNLMANASLFYQFYGVNRYSSIYNENVNNFLKQFLDESTYKHSTIYKDNFLMDAFLGISAGVMIAASFFSLLNPAFDMANSLKMNSVVVVTVSFLIGAIFLYFCDKLFDHLLKKHDATDKKSISLLIFSI